MGQIYHTGEGLLQWTMRYSQLCGYELHGIKICNHLDLSQYMAFATVLSDLSPTSFHYILTYFGVCQTSNCGVSVG